MKEKKMNGEIVVRQYRDIAQFIEMMGERKEGWVEYSSHRDSKPEWYGTKNYEEADNLLKNGDGNLTRKILSSYNRVTKVSSKSMRDRIVCDVVGFTPHVPNYIAGVPMNMVNKKRVAVPTPTMTIVWSRAADWTIDSDKLAEVSALVLAAVNEIQRGKVRVNLYCGTLIKSRYRKEKIKAAGWIFKLKDANKPLDVRRCAYPMAHTSMLRRHFFHKMECDPNVHNENQWNYGYVLEGDDKKRAYRETIKQCHLRNAVVLDYYDVKDCLDVKDVVRVIDRLLTTQNK